MTGLRLIPDGQAFYMTGNSRCIAADSSRRAFDDSAPRHA